MTGIPLELNDWKMQPQIIKILKFFLTNRVVIVKMDGFLLYLFPLDNGILICYPLRNIF